MFRKYEKTFRVVIPEINVAGKFALSSKEVKQLLGGQVVVEEKMDGANTGIIRHKKGFHLQKRGSLVGQSEHAQFQYFHNWANYQNYEKLMNVPVGYTIYGELLYAVHSIYYDSLPDYFLVFDVWDKRKDKFLNTDAKLEFCDKYGFIHTPIIAEGKFNLTDLYDMIPNESSYGDTCEGIVIKRYNKKGYTRGKIVKPEFIKVMEESLQWTRSALKVNKVNG